MLTLRCLLWFSNVDLRQIGSGSKGVVELPQWGQSTVWMYQASITIPCVVFPADETLTVTRVRKTILRKQRQIGEARGL